MRTDRYELEVNVDRGVYWCYLFVLKNCHVSYTRMVRRASGPRQARLVAREMVRTKL